VTSAGAAGDVAVVNAVNSVSFQELVTAATVGVSRRPLDIAALDGPAAAYAGVLDASDPAAAVLDAAALLGTARRAGTQPAHGVACPPAAPADTAPELSARAARVLRQLGGGQAPGFAAADSELLADLLTVASGAGYVAPAPLLPGLLDAAVRTAALRPAVAAVLGARGRWLARHRPDWQQVAEQAQAYRVLASQAGDGEASTASGPLEVWRTGSRAQRHAYLAILRDRDPKAARELLGAGWTRENGEDRATLLAVLARGLSPDDEEFLEAALDDRAGAVRATARRMLSRLPGSAFNRRATERAAAALRLAGDGPRRRLIAIPPRHGDLNAATVRDGIGTRPPAPSIGVGAWLLTEVIAAAPLASWTERLGLPPRKIVALPVERDLGIAVHAGWRLAAVSQDSSEWARALLDAGDPDDGGGRPPAVWPDSTRLAAVLPPDVRAARAAALLAGTNLAAKPADVNATIAEIAGFPVPWPIPLADAAVAKLGRAAALAVLPRLARALLAAAGRGLPAIGVRDYAAELTRLADAHPQTWSPLLRSAAETIALRRAFLEEIR
jgi:hypothetical protein